MVTAFGGFNFFIIGIFLNPLMKGDSNVPFQAGKVLVIVTTFPFLNPINSNLGARIVPL